VPVGDLSKIAHRAEAARRCILPVGDYTPYFVSVQYGPLSISMSNNYHTKGKPRGGTDGEPLFGIKIRRDKPFVLDFSNEPEVMFASPAKGKTFKPGNEVNVAAVLIDPVLDVMIRGLHRTEPAKQKKPKTPAKNTAAKKQGSLLDKIAKALGVKQSEPPAPAPIVPEPTRRKSLDPTVIITDSSGKEVARGKMPFG
jgi:hypothetical protein